MSMWPASPELPNFFMFHKTPFRNYVPTKIGLWVVAMFVIQRLRIEKLWNNLKLRDSLLPNLKCMGYNVGILSPWRPPCIKYPLPWASSWCQAGKPRNIWKEVKQRAGSYPGQAYGVRQGSQGIYGKKHGGGQATRQSAHRIVKKRS